MRLQTCPSMSIDVQILMLVVVASTSLICASLTEDLNLNMTMWMTGMLNVVMAYCAVIFSVVVVVDMTLEGDEQDLILLRLVDGYMLRSLQCMRDTWSPRS